MREWLKSLRIEKGYRLKEMGERLRISESYYAMIESGERQKKMDLTLASGLSVILGISVAEIIALEQGRG